MNMSLKSDFQASIDFILCHVNVIQFEGGKPLKYSIDDTIIYAEWPSI